jgi:hypothetical protein
MNDVTVLGEGGDQRFCDDSTRVIVLKKCDNWRGGVKNIVKLRDVIYGRPIIR